MNNSNKFGVYGKDLHPKSPPFVMPPLMFDSFITGEKQKESQFLEAQSQNNYQLKSQKLMEDNSNDISFGSSSEEKQDNNQIQKSTHFPKANFKMQSKHLDLETNIVYGERKRQTTVPYGILQRDISKEQIRKPKVFLNTQGANSVPRGKGRPRKNPVPNLQLQVQVQQQQQQQQQPTAYKYPDAEFENIIPREAVNSILLQSTNNNSKAIINNNNHRQMSSSSSSSSENFSKIFSDENKVEEEEEKFDQPLHNKPVNNLCHNIDNNNNHNQQAEEDEEDDQLDLDNDDQEEQDDNDEEEEDYHNRGKFVRRPTATTTATTTTTTSGRGRKTKKKRGRGKAVDGRSKKKKTTTASKVGRKSAITSSISRRNGHTSGSLKPQQSVSFGPTGVQTVADLNKQFGQKKDQSLLIQDTTNPRIDPSVIFRNGFEDITEMKLPNGAVMDIETLKQIEMQIKAQIELQNQNQNQDGEEDQQQQPQQTHMHIERQKRDISQEPKRSKQEMESLALYNKQVDNYSQNVYKTGNYINADLKYLNFDFLVEKFGHFDIILMDPPWRIKGGQGNDSAFMFSNSKFNLDYNTMSNQEIMDLGVERLSEKGFIFIWILNTQLNLAYEMLQKWGYEVIDQIIWVKLKDGKINLSHGYYFMHSFEICLVGFKSPPGKIVEYHSKVSNNLIFAELRKKSQKPEQMYHLIELMMPGAKKIELFARNHNLRPGWFSIGNQLGDTFEKWVQTITCNECNKDLKPGVKRLKSKLKSDYDICMSCLETKELKLEEFFQIENKVDEDILHYYHSCNKCHTEPIWGVRFHCPVKDCEYDLCEQCLDQEIALEDDKKFHAADHHKEMQVVEVPVFGNGFEVHSSRHCNCCQQRPIIGVCFRCKQCANFNLCQICFFNRTPQELQALKTRHKADHQMESIFNAVDEQIKTKYRCSSCKLDNLAGDVFKCNNCFNFYFCESCYLKQKDNFTSQYATAHKNYHTYEQVQHKPVATPQLSEQQSQQMQQ